MNPGSVGDLCLGGGATRADFGVVASCVQLFTGYFRNVVTKEPLHPAGTLLADLATTIVDRAGSEDGVSLLLGECPGLIVADRYVGLVECAIRLANDFAGG